MYTVEQLVANPTTRAILEEAQDMFLQQGFSQVEMKELAQRCQVARSTLYRYFPSRETLAFYLSLYLFATRPLLYRAQLPGATGYERLEASVRGTLELMAQRRAELSYFNQFDLIFSGSYPEGDVSRYYEDLQRSYDPYFLPLIQEGIADGSIRPLEDPRLSAVCLQNALMAMAQRVLPRSGHLRREQGYGEEMLYQLAEQLLAYYKYPKDKGGTQE